jgi:hypothetical protein
MAHSKASENLANAEVKEGIEVRIAFDLGVAIG